MVDVCYLTNVKYKRVTKPLEEFGVSYNLRHLEKDPWTLKEFQDLLKLTDTGLDEIISTNGQTYQELTGQGIQFEALRLQEVYELIVDYPSLLKLPVSTDYVLRLATGITGAEAFRPRHKKNFTFQHSRKQAKQFRQEENTLA